MGFCLKTLKRKWNALFSIYITQITTLEDGNHETCMDQKWGWNNKNPKFHLELRWTWNRSIFPSNYYFRKLTSLVNGNHKTCMGQHILSRKIVGKTTTKTRSFAWNHWGERMRLFFRLYHIIPLENGNHKICMGHLFSSQRMVLKTTKIWNFA